MSPADQQKVFQRPPRGQVKVVLSTNICETSITIDDVVCVVDSARVNETGYDVATGTSYLREEWCSKAARRQRSGRAGRVRPGECWSLITRKKANMIPAFPAPEIERVSIDQLYLRIESSMANNSSEKYVDLCSCMHVLCMRHLSPPSQGSMRNA
jgi:HrpA-like RNA helicase